MFINRVCQLNSLFIFAEIPSGTMSQQTFELVPFLSFQEGQVLECSLINSVRFGAVPKVLYAYFILPFKQRIFKLKVKCREWHSFLEIIPVTQLLCCNHSLNFEVLQWFIVIAVGMFSHLVFLMYWRIQDALRAVQTLRAHSRRFQLSCNSLLCYLF